MKPQHDTSTACSVTPPTVAMRTHTPSPPPSTWYATTSPVSRESAGIHSPRYAVDWKKCTGSMRKRDSA
eukprot:894519-Rhodomonas_salina.1